MKSNDELNKQRTKRNLIIFILVTLGCGWLGLWLDANSGEAGPGMLVWLAAPLLTAILLRTLGRDGWRDAGLRPNLLKHLPAYLLALLAHPAAIALIVGAGVLAGAVNVQPAAASVLGPAVAAGLAGNLIKNIFEEYAWRGYLAPRMAALPINGLAAHVLVGLVWGAWHMPYYAGLLDASQLQAYTPLGLATFLPLVIAGCVALSLFYGEMLFLTGSVLPALLMHTLANSIILPLLMQPLLVIDDSLHMIFTPGVEGILSIALYGLAGLWLYRRRLRGAKSA